MKKVIGLILVILMVIGDVGVFAQEETPASGQCGDDAYWSFDEKTNTLTISGTGDMYQYKWQRMNDNPEGLPTTFNVTKMPSPWDKFEDRITVLYIEEGITEVGLGILDGCKTLEKVVLGKSIAKIDYWSLDNCDNLSDIYYMGSEEDWSSIKFTYEGMGSEYTWDEYKETFLPQNLRVHFDYAAEDEGAVLIDAIKKNGRILYNFANIIGIYENKIYAWGKDYEKEPVILLENVENCYSSKGSFYAINNDGELYVWGNHEYWYNMTPTKKADIGVKFKYKGYGYMLGLESYEGNNEMLKEAEYTYPESYSPCELKPVKLMDNISEINFGVGYVLALSKNGDVYIWGGKAGVDGKKTPYLIAADAVSIKMEESRMTGEPAEFTTYTTYITKKSGEVQVFGDGALSAKEVIKKDYAEIFLLEEKEDYILITGCADKNIKEIFVPGEINGKKAVLGDSAFRNYDSVEKIVFGEGIEVIPAHLCHGDNNLKCVELPETVATICEDAFYECKSLAEVKHEGSIKRIEESAFGCTGLKEFDFTGVEYLGLRAFASSKLEKVKLTDLKDWYGIGGSAVDSETNIHNFKVSAVYPYHASDYELVKVVGTPFEFCMELKEVWVCYPETAEGGFKSLFLHCDNIEKVIFENFPEGASIWEFYNRKIEKLIHPVPENDPMGRYHGTSEEIYCVMVKPDFKFTIYGEGRLCKAYAEKLGVPFIDVSLSDKEEISVAVDEIKLSCDSSPYIKNGRTMVPMRAIFEALGATVTWNNETKTAIGTKDDVTLKITIGDEVLYKNGEAIILDAAAEIKKDRTMLPLRAISEGFGCFAEWDNSIKRAYITSREETEKGSEKFKATFGDITYVYYGNRVYSYDEDGAVMLQLDDVTSIQRRENSFYAVNGKGELYVWGENAFEGASYVLGLEEDNVQKTPVKILDNVKRFYLSTGRVVTHSENGDVHIWGGRQDPENIKKTPSKIAEGAKSITVSEARKDLTGCMISIIDNNGDLYVYDVDCEKTSLMAKDIRKVDVVFDTIRDVAVVAALGNDSNVYLKVGEYDVKLAFEGADDIVLKRSFGIIKKEGKSYELNYGKYNRDNI